MNEAWSADYLAHPMLDPHFLERDPVITRAFRAAHEGMAGGEDAYNRYLNRLLNPIDRPHPLSENLEAARRYFVDVNAYLNEVRSLLPADARRSLTMDAEVAARSDVQGLLDLVFRGDTPRIRFEAQRKIYLAKLLFDIDHDPGVQKGPFHKEYFEDVLERELWVGTKRMKAVDLFFELAEDGMRVKICTRRSHLGQERWRFYMTRLARRGARPVHIYHYACRFKREVAGFRYHEGKAEYEIEEQPIWATLHERRSGSILSKMIRKGEVHPSQIQDIIGAMFIVRNAREVDALQEVLFSIFGGPLRWKNTVNTIRFPGDRALLNAQSGKGYEVLKGDVDVLCHAGQNGRPPYLYSVEVQIYTLEGFLRTVHSRHYASHQRLKLRQFLEGLLPALFPVEIYGRETVRLCLAAEHEAPAA
jgi:hypothetical protein